MIKCKESNCSIGGENCCCKCPMNKTCQSLCEIADAVGNTSERILEECQYAYDN